MLEVTDEQFENFLGEAWKNIPAHFMTEMQNVTIRIETNPTMEQMERAHVHGANVTLLGLFDGIAKPQWGQATMGDQPSKISIFQQPIIAHARNTQELKNLIQEVLMHEIAHYFGYNDQEMCILDEKLRQKLKNYQAGF
jgi:predicted Zn-dependent protease with MMP-like domain